MPLAFLPWKQNLKKNRKKWLKDNPTKIQTGQPQGLERERVSQPAQGWVSRLPRSLLGTSTHVYSNGRFFAIITPERPCIQAFPAQHTVRTSHLLLPGVLPTPRRHKHGDCSVEAFPAH